MRETVTYVTQSRFFNPAFDAAIFDGPIRIYFAQFQEGQALKFYFDLQERYGDIRKNARGLFKERGTHIFVMLYPSADIFDATIGERVDLLSRAETGSSYGSISVHRMGSDYVLGVRGQVPDQAYESLFEELDKIVRPAYPEVAPTPL